MKSLNVGKQFKDLREFHGDSQRAAAKKLGVSFVHLNRVELGKALPSFLLLEKAEDVYGHNPYVMACFNYHKYKKLRARGAGE